MARYGWNTLPSEILASVLYYIDLKRNDHYWKTTTDLRSCQLVCKSWSKAAQTTLYKHISLGSNIIKFTRTIEQEAPHVGIIVKKLTFVESFLSIRNSYCLVRSVFSYCSFIEEMYFSDDHVRNSIWTFLAAGVGESTLCHVKIIDQDSSDKSKSYLYPFVALKFPNTLTKLELHIGHSQGNQAINNVLAKLVSKFKSLQFLYVDTCDYIQFDDMNQVLSDCSQKVYQLRFNNLRFSVKQRSLNDIQANLSITKISIAFAKVNSFAIGYFVSKFKSLAELDIGYMYYPTKQDQEEEWWEALSQLCSNTKTFSISMSLPTTFGGQRQLENCVELLVQDETANQKELCIDFENLTWDHMSDEGVYIYKNIVMKKTNSMSQISINVKDTEGAFGDKSTFINCFKSYSPNLIKIRNIEPMTDIYAMFTADSLKTDRLAPYFDLHCVGDIRQYFTRTCNERNWLLFHDALSLTSKVNESTISLSELVLCGVSPANHIFNQNLTKIREFHLINSIIYYTVFSEISSKLPYVHTFDIDTCSILMNIPYNLIIFLPSSRIHHFQLKINPFRDGTNRYPEEIEKCSLENLDLLKAVSLNGSCTLIIGANAQTLVYYKQNGSATFSHQVVTDHTTTAIGTKDNFLIWVKCKDLNEFSLVAKNVKFNISI